MIVFFDTSALLPLVVEEPSTPLCQRLWEDADSVVVSRLAYVETAAALALAERVDRVTDEQVSSAWDSFLELWPQVHVVDADESVIETAAGLTRPHGLRGYDAVQCASAVAIADEETVAASGDRRLLDAWGRLGVAVANTAAPDPPP